MKFSTSSTASTRIVAYDFARAFAILGMVLVNYKLVMVGDKAASPTWLAWSISLLEGRAAALFVILAGVGLSLFSQKARMSQDARRIAQHRNTLFKRALFLFLLGLLYTPTWPADILHFYGIYIAVGACVLTLPDRWLWRLVAIFTLVFLLLLLILDYEVGWKWETFSYTDFWTPNGMIRHLFFNGFHPVFPWTAFLLAGMWLGRRDLTDSQERRRLLRYSLSVALFTEGLSWSLVQLFTKVSDSSQWETIRALFGTKPMPPTPFYLLSAGGLAYAAIILSVSVTEKFSTSRWVHAFVVSGQLALTHYVAHVVIGMGVLEMFGLLNDQTLSDAAISALVFYAAALIFSIVWRGHFKRGPLEWIMRQLA